MPNIFSSLRRSLPVRSAIDEQPPYFAGTATKSDMARPLIRSA